MLSLSAYVTGVDLGNTGGISGAFDIIMVVTVAIGALVSLV